MLKVQAPPKEFVPLCIKHERRVIGFGANFTKGGPMEST